MLLPCTYKQLFGISCPTCGFQRSLYSLLDGNIVESIIFFSSVVLYVLCDNNFRNYFSQIQNTQNKDIEILIYYTLTNFDIKLYISEYYVFLIF